jgi:hypothetical protein
VINKLKLKNNRIKPSREFSGFARKEKLKINGLFLTPVTQATNV